MDVAVHLNLLFSSAHLRIAYRPRHGLKLIVYCESCIIMVAMLVLVLV